MIVCYLKPMRHNVKFSGLSIAGTYIIIAFFIGMILFWIYKGNVATWVPCAFGAILFGLLIAALFYMPVWLSIDKTAICIKTPLRIKRIPLDEVASMQLCPPTMAEMRLCGSGGFFGYWGWFREPSIGVYFAYYGKSSDCFLVRLKNGKQYMRGCQDPAEIVEYYESHR